MAEKKKVGYQIGQKFYPLVTIDAWNNGDFILAEEITHKAPDVLFDGETSFLTLQQALVGVAMWHAQPALKMEKVVQAVYALNPGKIVEVGMDDEGDARPPDADDGKATPKDSSKTSSEASESGREK